MFLSKLSDKQLIVNLKQTVKKESRVIAQVIELLGEVERRKLYSEYHFKSLYDYCVQVLGYSGDQAYRRVSAMRVSQQVPIVKERLQKGDLSLSNVNLLAPVLKKSKLNEKQQIELVDAVSNTSRRECKEILKKHFPQVQEDKMTTIKISEKTLEKIRLIQAEKSVGVDEAVNFLYQNYLTMKKEQGENLSSRRQGKLVGSKRYIPKQVKLMAMKKAKNKCENCHSMANLQYDHIRPFALGGESRIENIRILCRNCNLREGIKVFGAQKMGRDGKARGS